jgi:Zn-dependent protease with chaperone function
VPLIGLAVAGSIAARNNSELRRVVSQQNPSAPADLVSQMTVEQVCQRQDLLPPDVCGFSRNVRLLGISSAVAAVSGLGLVALIFVAGVAARRSRQVLLRIFKPGLYITACVLIVLVVVHAAIAIAVVYYGESGLFNVVHPAILFGIGVGALSGALAIAKHTFGVVQSATAEVVGHAIGRTDAPELWARVEDTARRLGSLAPENIVLGLDPSFFVTETDVKCLDVSLKGRTLYCSAPLLRILTVDEFLSVVGHELAHFKGLDTKFSQHFFPIYRGTVNSLVALQQAGGGSATRLLALLPAFALFQYFLECFAVAERRFSRERELAADSAGAGLTSTTAMGSALVKVHAFSGLWPEVQLSAIALLRRKQSLVNVSRTYANLAASRATPPILVDLAEQRMSHPTDSHPPLPERLAALGESVESVSASALLVDVELPAIALVNDPEAIEQTISDDYKRLLQDHPEVVAAVSDVEPPQMVAPADVKEVSDVLCRFCQRPLPVPTDPRDETVLCSTCFTRQAVTHTNS